MSPSLQTCVFTCTAFFSIPGFAPPMTPDAWAQYKNRDRLAESIHILDNPDWHVSDSIIARMKEANQGGSDSNRTAIEATINTMEIQAAQSVAEAAKSAPELQILLSRWTEHRNESVRNLAFAELVGAGHWSVERGMLYVQAHDPSHKGWYLLLRSLPTNCAPETRKIVARRVLETPRDVSGTTKYTGSSPLQIDALRVVSDEPTPADVEFLRSYIVDYPHDVVAWVAASRVTPNELLLGIALEVSQNESNSTALRCAAKLVLGQVDNANYDQIVEEFVALLSQCAGADFASWKERNREHIGDPAVAKRLEMEVEAERLLPVIFELPESVIARYADALLKSRYGVLGGVTASIVARRSPRAFIRITSQAQPTPREFMEPLFVAAITDQSIADEARRLIPSTDLRLYERNFDNYGMAGITAARFVLWR